MKTGVCLFLLVVGNLAAIIGALAFEAFSNRKGKNGK